MERDMKTITMMAIKFGVAILATLTFVSVIAGVYNYRVPSQMERGDGR
jgi:hypothetical protein